MALSDNQLQFFAEYILKELGIVYAKDNYYQLQQRLVKIAEQTGFASDIELYLHASKNGIFGDLKQLLLDVATNNETSFFRDPKIFGAFEKAILPSLKELNPKAYLMRVWSCASSFGQEPYSIAMLVHEFSQTHIGHPRFEIWGTDISDQALRRCKEARYTQLEIQRGLSAPRLVKYFTKDEENYWNLKNEVKSLVQFKKHNLLDPFAGFGLFDVIFCRYVLIYQDAAKKKEIIQRLVKSLTPKGYLVLGASESIIGVTDELEQKNFEGVVYYQKK